MSTKRTGKPAYTPDSRESSVIFWIAFVAILLTCVPYWLGFVFTPSGTQFAGYAFNIDDHYVYLSWMEQGREGHFFIRNLFTTDPQPILLFHLLFLLVGTVARLFHLSLWAANEGFRIVGAAVLLFLYHKFLRYCLPGDRLARIAAFAFTCFGSGFGWTSWTIWHDHNNIGRPIDAYQPEAYTFTSIYLFTLFVVSTAFILGTLFALLKCARTGKTRYAVVAGICALILGNIHSYDIFHISAAWGLFLICHTIVALRAGSDRLKTAGRLWLQSILALAMAMPTVLYTFYVYKHNPVFKARADSATRSDTFWHYIPGYGIEFLLAVAALVLLTLWIIRQKAGSTDSDLGENQEGVGAVPTGWVDRTTALFIGCWAVGGLAVIYIPFDFQRKMLMGEHLPLCLLAGWGVSRLTYLWKPGVRIAVAALLVLASAPSNLLFLYRDVVNMQRGVSETNQWPYLSEYEVKALEYLREQTPPDGAVLTNPILGLYVPGMTGHAVWAGHWSETPDYGGRMVQFQHFAEVPEIPGDPSVDTQRRAFLASTRCRYLLYFNDVSNTRRVDRYGIVHTLQDFTVDRPSYLVPVYSNKELTLYRIDL